MANNRVAYGLAKEEGIDTEGMSPKEVWEALGKKGITQESVSEGKIKETKNLQSKSIDELKEMAKPKEAKSADQIKNKNDLVDYIAYQTGITLENDPDNIWNNKRNLLYTKIDDKDKNVVLSLLMKKGFIVNEHNNGRYWISVKPSK